MKIPKDLRIGSYWYKVETVNGDTSYDGQADYQKRVIHLSDRLSDERKAAVLLHEVIHVLLEQYRVRMKDSLEEDVVWAIEHGLCSFAKDNQGLFQNMVKVMGAK